MNRRLSSLFAAMLAIALPFAGCGGNKNPDNGRVVNVTSVSLNKSTLELAVNEEERLVATIIPSNATDQGLTWSSDNRSVATVINGRVKGEAPGEADITVTTSNGNHTAKCHVYVINVAVTRVALDKTSTTLIVGNTDVLTPIFTPSNASNKNVTWSSSNQNVARVEGNGIVRAMASGSATITVTTQDGGKQATCAVYVMTEQEAVRVTGVSLNKTSVALGVGASDTLQATVMPPNATNRNVSWSSNNPGVATVTGGTVTAVSTGNATITVTTSDGGLTATCAVTVLTTVVPVTGVTLNKTSLTLSEGTTETLTATVQPGNATNKAVSWSTSNAGIATVSAVGLVTAVAPGSATITVTTADGNKTATCVVTVPKGVTVVSMTIAGGNGYSLGIKADGTLFAWGSNIYGKLGDGTSSSRTTPREVMGGANDWLFLAQGNEGDYSDLTTNGTSHTVAIKTDGSLWAWGYNYHGQLGNGDNSGLNDANPIPARVGTGNDWVTAARGGYHTVAVKKDGSLWAWGRNGNCQLGNNQTTDRNVPYHIGTATDWRIVSAGGFHTMAIKADGSLWAWGYNGSGRLGNGNTVQQPTPVQVGAAKDWVAVSAGSAHTLALKADGSLWAWGNNEYGQLGDSSYSNRNVPVQVGTAKDWKTISAGERHSVAIKEDGSLWAWGGNGRHQVGDGSGVSQVTPVRVDTDTDWVAIAAGNAHTLALKTDGSLWAWGYGFYGQLGVGDQNTRYVPVTVGPNWRVPTSAPEVQPPDATEEATDTWYSDVQWGE